MAKMVVRVRGPVKRQLRKLHRQTNDKGLAARCQIVLLWGEGALRFEIARAVGLSVSWVDRVIGRFRDHGVAGLHDRREDNGQTKVDEEYLAKLYEIVDKQPPDFGYPRPTWTQELLAKVMEELTGVKVHPATMCRVDGGRPTMAERPQQRVPPSAMSNGGVKADYLHYSCKAI